MYKHIIQLIFLFIILIVCVEESAADVFLNLNGVTSTKNIKSIEINNIKYVEFGKFIKYINPNVDINSSKNIIYSIEDFFYAKTSCDNFFIVFSHTKSKYLNIDSSSNKEISETILQLIVPTICNSGVNYIPIASFLHSLSQYVDFKYDVLDNGIYIHVNTNSDFYNFFCIKQDMDSTSSASVTENTKNPVKENKEEVIKNLEDNIKIEKYIENSKTTAPKEKKLKIRPLEKYNIDYFERNNYKYFVPDSLIKKQLNEL